MWQTGLWVLGLLACVNGAKLDKALLPELIDDIGLGKASENFNDAGEMGPGKQPATRENVKTNGETIKQNENTEKNLLEIADVHKISDMVKLHPSNIYKEKDLLTKLINDIGLGKASENQNDDGEMRPGKQPTTRGNVKTNVETIKQNENTEKTLGIAGMHKISDMVKLRPSNIHKEKDLDHTYSTLHGKTMKEGLHVTPHTQSNITDLSTGGVETMPNKQALTTKDDILADENPVCSLRQTMAWQECHKKVVCDFACKNGADCTFPYCNSLGLCECIPAFCKTDRMCHFFRIECHGNFTCQNDQCICG